VGARGRPGFREGAMDDWVLGYNAYQPELEGLREALCTLGNGYVATRGAAPRVAT